MKHVPVPFEAHESGAYLHGTKAEFRVGDVLVSGHASNFEQDRIANHIYVAKTLDAATWGAELARGERRGHIYIVEPEGELEDDRNVTDKRFPDNPTLSYRTKDPVCVVGELRDWAGHPPEQIQAMTDGLAALRAAGQATIID